MSRKKTFGIGLLDKEFDDDPAEVDPYERLVFGAFDGDMRGRPEKGPGGMSRATFARRKRKTVSTDEPETVFFPEDAPPGWAKP